ncbi:hypothetical protein ANCCAN_04221 [Ancylostoma caninum]|uniref:Uncharacterized protein n=1 Tax=Ancylostoma caninum TaxID=29170 RepID=A0A368GZJ9_ANCCA|nr:hypothetical protein ANCCAN_04221 [Ancylostoma caninum]
MPSNDQRMVLFTGVEALAPSKDVGLKILYECALEGMAGLILESPEKPHNCAQSLGIFPLTFEISETAQVLDAITSRRGASTDTFVFSSERKDGHNCCELNVLNNI